MIILPYKGHYVTSAGLTVYGVDPPMTDGWIKKGDEVMIGHLKVTVEATEHYMTRSHPIVGIAVKL